jgi:hypothetical protein
VHFRLAGWGFDATPGCAVIFTLLIALSLPSERFAVLPEKEQVPKPRVVGIVPPFKPSKAPRHLYL